MDDVTDEMLAGRTVICVSRAGPLRGYRCDWWAVQITPVSMPELPPGVKVCADARLLAASGREGITTRELRDLAGLPNHFHLAADAIKLAWHLGHRDIEVWGADWCGKKSLHRWVREAAEWWETVRRLGLTVTRNGETMLEVPFCEFMWGGDSRDDRTLPLKERLSRYHRMHEVEMGALLKERDDFPCAIRGVGHIYLTVGDAAPAVHEAVTRAVGEGRMAVSRNELGTMYEIPDEAGRKGVECPRGERAPVPRAVGAMPPRTMAERETMESRWARVGPKLWAELHARPAKYQGDVAAEMEWLEGFAGRLSCGECKTHWRKMTAATPPDLTSAAAYYQWTVDSHNAVNVRLGKAVWGGGRMPGG
jgi:hypothetical protein